MSSHKYPSLLQRLWYIGVFVSAVSAETVPEQFHKLKNVLREKCVADLSACCFYFQYVKYFSLNNLFSI